MIDIELNEAFAFKGVEDALHTVTAIKVAPLNFLKFVAVWSKVPLGAKKPAVALQQQRILEQAHFMVGGERFIPTIEQLGTAPGRLMREVRDQLDSDQGVPGKVLTDGDGATKPLLYKLGTPIGMRTSKDADASITELEFMGTTYSEMEDVLAADNELEQAIALIRTIAKPVGGKMPIMTDTTMEQITMADGVTIMRAVLPRF